MELKKSRVKKRLREGEVCIGTMLRILNTPHAVPLCASQGWDYVILDTEHNDYDLETLGNILLTAKYEDMEVYARIPDTLYFQMAQMLDVGAEGLVLPQVKTAKEAKHIIRSSKFVPMGSRGVSVSNTVTRFRDYDLVDYLRWANEEIMIIVQIESQQGVENIDQILSQKGIDAVMIGPADLSTDMDIPGQTNHCKLVKAYQKVIDSCHRHDVVPGIHVNTFEEVDKRIEQGMRLITFSYDIKIIQDASKSALKKIYSLIEKEP